MILYAVLGLLLVAMIVFAVMSARKDWHWINPVLLVFIFIAGSAGMIGMAQTLHLRRTVLTKISKGEERVARAEAEKQQVIFGDIASSEYSPDSLRGRTQQVELLQLGRGRVWTGGTVSNVDGEIEFKFPAEKAEVEDQNLSLANVELYAFANDNNGIPVRFVGKFAVVEDNPSELFLERSVPIADWQEYGQPTKSWTLFERMPFDKHGVFRDLYRQLAPNDPAMSEDNFDIAKFRDFLMNNELAFKAENMGMDPASAEYERLIDEFTFDGLSIGTIRAWVEKNADNRVSPRFEPSPSEVFVKYKFTGNSNETYTVDDKTGKLDTDGTFSIQGHAVDPLLQLSPGEESRDVTFKKDDTVEIDLVTVEGYQRPDGQAVPPFTDREPNIKEVDRVYRRKLVDFPFEMTKLYNRGFQADNDSARLVSNNEVQDTALKDATRQQQERTREKVAFENDNNLLQNDLDRVTATRQQREQQVADAAREIAMRKQQIAELRRAIEIQSTQISSSSR